MDLTRKKAYTNYVNAQWCKAYVKNNWPIDGNTFCGRGGSCILDINQPKRQ